MPQLAEEILKRNEKVKVDGSAPVINFSGFLVGNPYTDARSNEVGARGWGGGAGRCTHRHGIYSFRIQLVDVLECSYV